MPMTSAIATSRLSTPGVSMQSQPLNGTRRKIKFSQSDSVGFCGSPQPSDIRRRVLPFTRVQSTIKCAVSNARCSGGGAEQTQTILRKTPSITHLPGKEKNPQLADGDGGLPPRDDDDGGGGGGGGNWSGGFFFFGFLALLGLLMDREKDDEN